MGSEAGLSAGKLKALDDYASSSRFDEREKVALAYADAITLSDQDVDDALFARLEGCFDTREIVELTAVIAWENASSKFNRALRVPSQELYRGGGEF